MSIFQRSQKEKRPNSTPKMADKMLDEHKNKKLSGNLEDTISFIQSVLGDSDDFSVRRFNIFGRYPAAMFYFSNLLDKSSTTDMLKPFMNVPPQLQGRSIEKDQLKEVLLNDALYQIEGKMDDHLSAAVEGILRGEIAFVAEGLLEAFLVETPNSQKRAIESPQTEQVIRGSREGFIESLGTNIALLRHRLPTADFRVKNLRV